MKKGSLFRTPSTYLNARNSAKIGENCSALSHNKPWFIEAPENILRIATMMARFEDRSDRLIVSRKEAAQLLGGISVVSVIRLEQKGLLPRVRLDPRVKSPKAFYRLGDVIALTKSKKEDQ